MNIIVAVLLLGIVIIIHELGHFMLAKKNKITVTEFSIGMGPRIASFVKNGTRYSLKALPFGGSCIMLGEDETVNDSGAFGSKSVGARFSVIFAGAFFNFILAFVLALIVIGAVGVDYPDVNGIRSGSPAHRAGIMAGDRIIGINNRTIHFSKEVDVYFFFNPLDGDTLNIRVLRDGKKLTLPVTPEKIPYYQLGIYYLPGLPAAEISEVNESFPLPMAGIKPGDIITAVNGTKIVTSTDLSKYFEENPLTGEEVEITFKQNGEEKTVTVTPQLVSNTYEIGWRYNVYRVKTSPWETIKNSIYEVKYNILYAVNSLGYLITGKASVNEITGPVGIVSFVGDIVDETKDEGAGMVILSLANFGILLSANLGVMNLLPLPALDGGRLVFLILEAIRRKPVPKEKEAVVHMVGMALLMILMILVLFNDIRNIFMK